MVCYPPAQNEYQRALQPAQPSVRAEIAVSFHDLPPYGQTSITEWGACYYAKVGDIKAKSFSGLVTYFSRYPILDWDWLQRETPDWITCPCCGRSFPHDARYWWWRNREKGYLWLDACRDCKCKTHRRVRDKKRLN